MKNIIIAGGIVLRSPFMLIVAICLFIVYIPLFIADIIMSIMQLRVDFLFTKSYTALF